MKLYAKYILSLFLIILTFNTSFAETIEVKKDTSSTQKKWYIPDAIKIQFAGNAGFISGGIVYKLPNNWYEIAFIYGSTSIHTGNNTLNTITLKNDFDLYKFKIKNVEITPTAGFDLSLTFSHNVFRKLPKQYPKKYYFQNKIHFQPNLGASAYYKINNYKVKGIKTYVQIGTFDNYLLEFIRTKYIKLEDIVSMGVGINIYF